MLAVDTAERDDGFDGKSSDPGSGDTLCPAPNVADRFLEEFLAKHIRAGAGDRAPIRQADARERVWLPTVIGAEAGAPKVSACKAAVGFLFPGIPELKLPRGKPGPGWGRRKRFSSLGRGTTLYAASSLEFDAMRDCELDPTNTWFIEQPLRLRYKCEGAWRTCQPDLLVVRPTHVECIEVKYEIKAALPENEVKFAAIGSAFQALGMGYRVMTELHVRRLPRFSNVCAILARRHVRVDLELERSCLSWLRGNGPARAGELQLRCCLSLPEIWSMTRRLLLSVDLDARSLGEDTLVRLRADQFSPDAVPRND